MGICSQKGNLSPKHRSHQQDRESIWITSVPYFLIEKNTKYIFRATGEKKMGDGNVSQKGNYQPNDRELFLDHVSGWQLISSDGCLIEKMPK